MKQNLSGDLLIITPEEGYVLALQGDVIGKVAKRLILHPNSSLLNRIVEIPYEERNKPKIPSYIKDQQDLGLVEFKQYIINQTKILLENYLDKHPLKYQGSFYNVSSSAQNHLLSMIKAGEMAQEMGKDFTVFWAPSGEVRREWTLIDLKMLFVEIQAYVNKFVMQQQIKEQEILAMASRDTLLKYDLNYYE